MLFLGAAALFALPVSRAVVGAAAGAGADAVPARAGAQASARRAGSVRRAGAVFMAERGRGERRGSGFRGQGSGTTRKQTAESRELPRGRGL
jgi:hypothetical protein